MSMKVNKVLPSPAELKEEYPLSEELIRLKKERDTEIRDIFTGKSDKFAVIIGPCSADNEDSVCEYVSRLAKVNEKVKDRLMLIPRIYTNKPRTTGEGYKGMLHQPDPDKAPDLYAGIMAIRKMHIRAMKESGLTAADEMLYPENNRSGTDGTPVHLQNDGCDDIRQSARTYHSPRRSGQVWTMYAELPL